MIHKKIAMWSSLQEKASPHVSNIITPTDADELGWDFYLNIRN